MMIVPPTPEQVETFGNAADEQSSIVPPNEFISGVSIEPASQHVILTLQSGRKVYVQYLSMYERLVAVMQHMRKALRTDGVDFVDRNVWQMHKIFKAVCKISDSTPKPITREARQRFERLCRAIEKKWRDRGENTKGMIQGD